MLKPVTKYDNPEIAFWFDRLERAHKALDEDGTYKRWDKNERFEDALHYADRGEDEDDAGDQITINKVGSYTRKTIATICPKRPSAVMRLRNNEDAGPLRSKDGEMPFGEIPKEQVAENLLNAVVQDIPFGFFATLRRSAKNGILTMGVAKCGFAPEFANEPDETDQEFKVNTDGTIDYSAYEIDPTTGLPARDPETNRLILKNGGIVRELFFAENVSPYEMLFDPDGGPDFRTHSWVAMKSVRSLASIKADKNLKNTKDLQPTGISMFDRREDTSKVRTAAEVDAAFDDDELRDRCKNVTLFEIWDFDAKKLIVLAEGHGKWLRKANIPTYIDHSPFVFFRPIERPDKFVPRPPATDLVPLNEEYDQARNQQMTARRHADRILLYDTGVFKDEDSLAKVRATGDLRTVGVAGLQAMPAPPMLVLSSPPLSMDAFNDGQQLARDFDEAGLQASEARGMASSRTATGVDAISTAMSIGDDDLRNLFAEFIRELYSKLWACIRANMRMPQAIAVTGRNGKPFTGTITKEMIDFDFIVDVDVTEMMPRNSNTERSQFVSLMQGAPELLPEVLADPAGCAAVLDMWVIRNVAVRDAFTKGAQNIVKRREAELAAMQAQGAGGGMPGSAGPGVTQPAGGAIPPTGPANMAEIMGGTNAAVG